MSLKIYVKKQTTEGPDIWVSVDPNDYISPDTGQLTQTFTVDAESAYSDRMYVYSDWGSGYFDDDWEIRFEIKVITNGGFFFWNYLTNDFVSHPYQMEKDGDPHIAMGVSSNAGDVYNFTYFINDSGNSVQSAPTDVAENTTYYVKWYKSSGVDAINLEVYSDSGFTTLLGSSNTATDTPITPGWDYRYFAIVHNEEPGPPFPGDYQHTVKVLSVTT
jgi:hypothetical protein